MTNQEDTILRFGNLMDTGMQSLSSQAYLFTDSQAAAMAGSETSQVVILSISVAFLGPSVLGQTRDEAQTAGDSRSSSRGSRRLRQQETAGD